MPKKSATLSKQRFKHTSPETTDLVIPAIEESVSVTRRVRETGKVKITKSARYEDEVIEATEMHEEIEVKRFAKNQVLDKPATAREEGNVTIIPVMEEVAIVTKKWVLREEIHLIRHVEKSQKPQTVTLRKERVNVEKTRLK